MAVFEMIPGTIATLAAGTTTPQPTVTVAGFIPPILYEGDELWFGAVRLVLMPSAVGQVLTLKLSWDGAAVTSGTACALVLCSPQRYGPVLYSKDVSEIAAGIRSRWMVTETVGTPPPDYGEDGNLAVDMTTNPASYTWYKKAAGVWSATTNPLTGAAGPANSLSIGTVTTLSAGSSATATLTGTAPAQTLNLGIPRGTDGAGGITDPTNQAIVARADLLDDLRALGVPEQPNIIADFMRNTLYSKDVAIARDIAAFATALTGGFTRASVATYFNSAGTLVDAASGVPRLAYDPSTLAARGLLLEPARTNSIRNAAGAGLVAGSPGTIPNNWTINLPSGLSRTLSALGTENGMDYVEIRVAGTASAAGTITIQPESSSQIAAASGQIWTSSFWAHLTAGAMGALSPQHYVWERDASTTALVSSNAVMPFTSSFMRVSRSIITRTLTNGATAYITNQIRIDVSNGAVIDFTVRIYCQLEQGATASSPIRTTGSAVARAADALNLPGAAGQVGTLLAVFGRPAALGTNLIEVSAANVRAAGSATNMIRARALNQSAGTLGSDALIIDGGSITHDVTDATVASGPARIAMGYAAGDVAFSIGGAAATTTTTALPAALAEIYLYGVAAPIERVLWWPTRLSNAKLALLSGATL